MAGFDAVIVGATLDGLTAGAVLSQAGLKVAVLERGDVLGGAFRHAEISAGFHGPALRHDDETYPASIIAELGLSRFGLAVRDLPGTLSITREGVVALANDDATTQAFIAARSQRDAEALVSVRAEVERLTRHLRPALQSAPAAPLDALGQPLRGWLGDHAGRQLLRAIVTSADQLTAQWFDDRPLRDHLAREALTLTGLDPHEMGTGIVLLMRAANGQMFGRGVLPVGGVRALIEALAETIRSAGGEIRLGADVLSIIVSGGRVRGAALTTRDMVEARAVFSALDVKRTFLTLIDTQRLPPQMAEGIRRYQMRGTLAKATLALSGLPTFADMPAGLIGGAILIDMAGDGRWLDVRLPSVLDPDLAPAGKHVLSVIMHGVEASPTDGAWTAERREALLGEMIQKLEQAAPGMAAMIVGMRLLTGHDIETEYRASGGDILGGTMSPLQLGWNRPIPALAGYLGPAQGLYLCGEATHPGPLMPGQSGANAARAHLARLGRRS
ncbi:MAG: NAD(P)-binding protein [Alphaproteobacteria bacterium]|nr:NAD(P)-binding protein [Alphaproteobacteria bacterium]